MGIPDTAATIERDVADMLLRQIPAVAFVGPLMARLDAEIVATADRPTLAIRVAPYTFDEPGQLRVEAQLTICSITVDGATPDSAASPASDTPLPRR